MGALDSNLVKLKGHRILGYTVSVVAAGSSTAVALAFIRPRNFTSLEYFRHPFVRLYCLCLLEAGVVAALLVACLQLIEKLLRFRRLWAWAGSGAVLCLGLVWGLASLGSTFLGENFTSLNLWLFIAVGGPQFLVQIGAFWVSAPVGAITASALYSLQRVSPEST